MHVMPITRLIICAGILLSCATGTGSAESSAAPLNTLRDVVLALRACWIPPPMDAGQFSVDITVRLSFKGDGEILGKPFITFESPNMSDETRSAYRRAVAEAFIRCTPLKFSEALGAAIAGHPFTLRFGGRVERRANVRATSLQPA
jgi:hypothetical protein